MAQQHFNTGATANDHTGDYLRDAFLKVEANFNELYGVVGSGYLPLDYGNLAILAKGVQGGVPNVNKTVKEVNDLVWGRWSENLFIKIAVYNGPDPEDIASYNVLESVDIP